MDEAIIPVFCRPLFSGSLHPTSGCNVFGAEAEAGLRAHSASAEVFLKGVRERRECRGKKGHIPALCGSIIELLSQQPSAAALLAEARVVCIIQPRSAGRLDGANDSFLRPPGQHHETASQKRWCSGSLGRTASLLHGTIPVIDGV